MGGTTTQSKHGVEIGLAEMVTALRAELERSIAQGTNKPIRFALGEIVLEVEMAVEREVGASGGVKFWVVTVGGSANQTKGTTHRVTITMTAEDTRRRLGRKDEIGRVMLADTSRPRA